MYHGVVVDGSSACIPGQVNDDTTDREQTDVEDDGEDEDEQDDELTDHAGQAVGLGTDGFGSSPISGSSSRKRGTSSVNRTGSSSKKSRGGSSSATTRESTRKGKSPVFTKVVDSIMLKFDEDMKVTNDSLLKFRGLKVEH